MGFLLTGPHGPVSPSKGEGSGLYDDIPPFYRLFFGRTLFWFVPTHAGGLFKNVMNDGDV